VIVKSTARESMKSTLNNKGLKKILQPERDSSGHRVPFA